MPRRAGLFVRREVLPDPKYNSQLIAKFINFLMRCGKKSVAQQILYSSMDIAEKRARDDGLDILRQAINNVKPVLEIRSRRVGGQTYQVPVDVKAERRTTLALRWIIQSAKARGEKTMAERLAGELLDASRNEGAAIRRKLDQHRMAEANRAFAHYRW
ncbi:MAG: 30S ribosomal protein S7 [Candidatus Poribacteria bacterium]|nr:30S ribosomal protein S7 [Candidatus Poribacteria bacterium]